MELFKKLSDIMSDGSTLSINVAKKDGSFVVSVLPGNPLVKDKAVKSIVPLNLRGTAEELDEGFVGAIEQPIQKTNGFFADLEKFEKAQKAAREASEMEKKAKEEAKKNTENFTKWMELSEQNFKEEKYKDAVTCAKNALKYSETISGGKAKAEALIKKITDESAEGLFGAKVDKSDGKNVKISAKSTALAAKEDNEEEEDDEND